MRPGPGARAAAAVLLLVLSACTGAEPEEPPTEPTVAGSGPAAGAEGPPRLPTTGGPPEQLEAGTYQAPDGFEPPLSVTVPDGWWGGGSAAGWSVGQGNDEANQRYRDAGVLVDTLALPYGDAVRAFRRIDGLIEERRPRRHRVDTAPATTFMTHAAQPLVLEDALGVGVDVGPHSWSQTFVDLGNGATLLVRTELVDEAAVGSVEGVVASLSFL